MHADGGLLPGGESNRTYDPAMRLASYYGQLTEVLIQRYEDAAATESLRMLTMPSSFSLRWHRLSEVSSIFTLSNPLAAINFGDAPRPQEFSF